MLSTTQMEVDGEYREVQPQGYPELQPHGHGIRYSLQRRDLKVDTGSPRTMNISAHVSAGVVERGGHRNLIPGNSSRRVEPIKTSHCSASQGAAVYLTESYSGHWQQSEPIHNIRTPYITKAVTISE